MQSFKKKKSFTTTKCKLFWEKGYSPLQLKLCFCTEIKDSLGEKVSRLSCVGRHSCCPLAAVSGAFHGCQKAFLHLMQ